ncbi:hemoglobin and hemoglobin-haptoglobin-binding protein A-like [Daphnia pulex]|uniref:hemoglobin and hemoglobin-haptoglobin-binding protein A-like n=1 Tax=Daphnia pulex TaxID=6669 RepID=UPI001EDFFF51|nr:hemoglobin and hemoglobin-haptoglobin-binding protein A-like [Daphnia pulex]
MKFSASAALILLACVVYVSAYGTHRPTTHRPTHYPTRPTYRPTYRPTHRPTHRPTYRPTHRPIYRPMKKLGNSNVNINDNKNSNVDIASLLSELFGQEEEFPCTIGDLCYEKKNLIKSGAAAVDAKKTVEPTEKAVEKSVAPAAPAAAPAVAPAAPAADVNFDQFTNFADFQNDDVIFAVPSEMDEGDDDFFA